MRLAQTPEFDAYRCVPTLDVFATSDWRELALGLPCFAGLEAGEMGLNGREGGLALSVKDTGANCLRLSIRL